MIKFQDMDNVYIHEGFASLTKKLKDDGVVERQVDLLVVGAAHAIVEQLPPLKNLTRHDLTRAATIPPEIRLALEATLPNYARELQIASPDSPKALLELLARAGSAGLKALHGEWESLSPGQIRLRLLGLASRQAPQG